MTGTLTTPAGSETSGRDQARAIAVIVATRNRPRDLDACLRSLLRQTHRAALIVVVDDAPGGDLTPAVVAGLAPRGPLRYVEGPRRGLAAAHNRGLEDVDTPLVAFTDDDTIADPYWLERIVDVFVADEQVGCVTGMIRPWELTTEVQVMLEGYAGFNKGTVRRVFDLGENRPDDPLYPFTAGRLGSGANMAFRRSTLQEMGGFDPALGAGTRARGGDDLSAFFEVIQHGRRLVYEPEAIIHHRHADNMVALERSVYGYGVGLTAYLTKSLLGRPDLLATFARRLPEAIAHIRDPRSAKNAGLPADYPRELVRLERIGMLAGPFAYLASRWAWWRAR
jgi:GT2 family glycosyltransferase